MDRVIKYILLTSVFMLVFFTSYNLAYYIVIDSIYTKKGIAPVYFPHRLHYDKNIKGAEFPCIRCHHELKNGSNKNPSSCVVCHLTEDKIKNSKNNKIPIADKKLYHNLCVSCHKEYKNQFPKIPIECKYCHFNSLRAASDESLPKEKVDNK